MVGGVVLRNRAWNCCPPQPICLAFALTLWAVLVWTPDQMVLAFVRRYGSRFQAYGASVPYVAPRLRFGKRLPKSRKT